MDPVSRRRLTMPRRQDRFGYGVTIPAMTARVVDTAVEILGDPDPSEMAFLHSVLAQTFLPYVSLLARMPYFRYTNST